MNALIIKSSTTKNNLIRFTFLIRTIDDATVLNKISENSLANKNEIFTGLYRYLLRPDIYFVAYKNLYANDGAATKGVNDNTADGFSEARLFPMDARQRHELFLVLQEHSTYKVAKFDTITRYEAEEILDFLKGKSQQKPDKLMSPKEWERYRLEAKYQAIAQKTLAATFSQLADKPLPDALAEKIRQLHLPISPEQLSLAEGIHLLAYYGEYPLKFAPAKRNDHQVSPSKATQLKELLSLKGETDQHPCGAAEKAGCRPAVYQSPIIRDYSRHYKNSK